jgi:hypothetical protein
MLFFNLLHIKHKAAMRATEVKTEILHLYVEIWMDLNNNKQLMKGVKTWLSSQVADFFHIGIQKLIP